MKKYIYLFTFFFSILNLKTFAQETIDINERFTAGEKHDYSFYQAAINTQKPVKLIIYGTDYDYDSDGDYTDFAIYINGEEVIYAEELTKYGLGKDGAFNEAIIDISQFVQVGYNSVTLENTENSGQRDYNNVKWIKIVNQTSNIIVNNRIDKIQRLQINIPAYVQDKFTCQTSKKYIFTINNTSYTQNARLILYGYDYDFDNDGDFTDFSISVNGNKLFEYESLRDKGFGENGNSKKIIFNIGQYLKSGNNEIILENTELSGQVDYVYLKSIEVNTGNMQAANIRVNIPYNLNKRFNSQDVNQLTFYINDPSKYNELNLKITGTDYDYDNDGDYTDFLLEINSNTLINTEPLTISGLGKNGNYSPAVFDIRPYITAGNNTITLKNTEDFGQEDYVYIKTIEIAAEQQTIANTPPEIIITQPAIDRGFKIVSAQKTLLVKGRAVDNDGISSVLVNGQTADLSYKGEFSAEIPVINGNNNITVVAIDQKGMPGTKNFIVQVGNTQTLVVNDKLPSTGKFYALIIGVSDYDDPNIPDLNGEPTKDARELYNILTQQYTFEPQNVKLLLNPTYRQVIRAFDDFSKIVKENDNFLIFYAGHGNWDENNEIGYWLPKDAELEYTDAWLYNSVLVDNIRKVNSKHTLLLADACFSGGIFKARSLPADASRAIKKKYELKSRNAITSGALKTVPNRSVFFKYLSDRLRNNQEKYLAAGRLFRQIEIPVGNNSPNTPQYGDIRNVGDEGGDFIFIKK